MNTEQSTDFCMIKNLPLTTEDHRSCLTVKEEDKTHSLIDVHLFFTMNNVNYSMDYYGIGDIRNEGKYTKTHLPKADLLLPKDAPLLKTTIDSTGQKHFETVYAEDVAEERSGHSRDDKADTAQYIDYFENKKKIKDSYTKNMIADLVESVHNNDIDTNNKSTNITIKKATKKKEDIKSGISSVFTEDNIQCKVKRKVMSSKEAAKHFWKSERFDIPCLRMYEGQKGTAKNDITVTQVDENRKKAQLYFWVDGLHLRGSFTEPVGMITDNNETDNNGRHICTVTLPEDFEFTVIGYETKANEYGAKEVINLDKSQQQKISVKTVYELREGGGSSRNPQRNELEDFGDFGA